MPFIDVYLYAHRGSAWRMYYALCSLHNLRRQSGVFSHQKYRQYCTESENERKRTGGHDHHGITVVGIPDPLTWIWNKVHIYLIELYFQLGINSVEFDNGVKQVWFLRCYI